MVRSRSSSAGNSINNDDNNKKSKNSNDDNDDDDEEIKESSGQKQVATTPEEEKKTSRHSENTSSPIAVKSAGISRSYCNGNEQEDDGEEEEEEKEEKKEVRRRRKNGSPRLKELGWNQSVPPSLSMSADLQKIVNGSSNNNSGDSSSGDSPREDSGHYSSSATSEAHRNATVDRVADDSVAESATSSCSIKIIAGQDEEESYEAFGSVAADVDDGADGVDGADSPGGSSSSAPSPTGINNFRNPTSPNSTIGRHSWLRTSLRRTPPCSGRKRLSSNALASQLYRSGSFNSSGRGSNCDTTDDMYSDVSLEEDVIDLSHRVQMIQEQMHALADTQSVGEERYVRAKQENATLQARILILEEAAKDAEARAEERLQAEQRRHREWASRLERERQLQLENYAIKLQAVELESSSLRDEIGRLREQLEKVKGEKDRLQGELEDARKEASAAKESERQAIAKANEAHYMLQAAKEELLVRAEEQQKLEELGQQVAHLRARNKSLEETRDELQAAAAVQAGRELLMLNPSCGNTAEKGPSLAAELLAGMNQDQINGHVLEDYEAPCCISDLKQALKEQQEVNAQLRAYIDGILLNIVENYPQLLEVKQAH